MDRSATRRMLREDGSLELYESEAEFQASLPGWAARRALRDRIPASGKVANSRDYQPGSRRVLHARHLRARLEDRRRPEGPRQGAMGLRGSGGEPFSCTATSGSPCRRRQRIVVQLRHGRTHPGAASW